MGYCWLLLNILHALSTIPFPMFVNPQRVLIDLSDELFDLLEAEAARRFVSVDILASLIYAMHARGELDQLDKITPEGKSFRIAADRYLGA